MGYTYREPNEDPEITDSALHLMTLLQALSGQVQVVLNSHDQQTCRDALGEFSSQLASLSCCWANPPQAISHPTRQAVSMTKPW